MSGTLHAKEQAPLSRSTAGRREQAAARLSLCSNICLVILKLAAGFASHSISVMAEGVQSMVDVVASGLILVTVRAAAAPPDSTHPYGHGKFENIASLGQMMLILGSAGYLLSAAWNRWQDPVMPHLDWSAAALGVGMGVNLIVSRRLLQTSRETGSQALRAEASHLQSDLFSSAGVLGGLVIVALTRQPRLDPAIAAVMAGYVVYSAMRLLRETLGPLLDERLPVAEEGRVLQVLDGDSRIRAYHRLRTRQAGAQRLVDVHILLDDQLSFAAAHAITEEVEDAIRDTLPNASVIVHAEPFEAEMEHQRERHGGEISAELTRTTRPGPSGG